MSRKIVTPGHSGFESTSAEFRGARKQTRVLPESMLNFLEAASDCALYRTRPSESENT